MLPCSFFRFRNFGMKSEHSTCPVLEPDWAPGQAGIITLLHNIIIAGDDQTRAWFAQYLKCMQQKVTTKNTLLEAKGLCGLPVLVSQPLSWEKESGRTSCSAESAEQACPGRPT